MEKKKNNAAVTVILPRELKEALRAEAQETDRKVAAIIRLAIKEHLGK